MARSQVTWFAFRNDLLQLSNDRLTPYRKSVIERVEIERTDKVCIRKHACPPNEVQLMLQSINTIGLREGEERWRCLEVSYVRLTWQNLQCRHTGSIDS